MRGSRVLALAAWAVGREAARRGMRARLPLFVNARSTHARWKKSNTDHADRQIPARRRRYRAEENPGTRNSTSFLANPWREGTKTALPASCPLDHRLERYGERGEGAASVVEQHRHVGAERHGAQYAHPLPLLRHLRGRRAICVLRGRAGARSQQREGA